IFSSASSQGTSEQPQNNVADTSTAEDAASRVPDYQNVALSELVTDKHIVDNTLVRVEGTVKQKGKLNAGDLPSYAGASYFLKINDGTSSMLVMATDDLFAHRNIGDVITVQGPIGSLGYCGQIGDSDWLKNVCQETGMSEPITREIQAFDGDAITV